MSLATKIVSEIMKPHPDSHVAAFIDGQPVGRLFVPSLVMAELRPGIARVPEGCRRAGIESDFMAFCSMGFASRILSFDDSCATGHARARSARE